MNWLKNLKLTEWLGIAGFFIAVGNLIHNIWKEWRDRERLKITSEFHPFFLGAQAVTIRAVNSGRRLIILTALHVKYRDATLRHHQLTEDDTGISLTEKQTYQMPQQELDELMLNDQLSEAVNMWFLDSLDKCHKIRGVEQNLKLYREYCDALMKQHQKESPPQGTAP